MTRRERAGKAPIGLRIKGIGELGALGVAYHRLQFDTAGTSFDLRRDGRQDTMFLFGRLALELEVDDHHQSILLFQPLRLRTQTIKFRGRHQLDRGGPRATRLGLATATRATGCIRSRSRPGLRL